jgi:integrase
VAGALVELKGKGLVYGPPKARASLRTNALPEAIRPAIVEHLARYVKDSPDAWVFTGERGNPIRSGNRNLLTGWKDAVTVIGRPRLHFHDLRHTGNTLAAQTYVSTKDLMARMGQDSPRAALIYQHASRRVDQTIADKLSALIEGIGSTVKDRMTEKRTAVWRFSTRWLTARRQHAGNIDRPFQRPRSTEDIP